MNVYLRSFDRIETWVGFGEAPHIQAANNWKKELRIQEQQRQNAFYQQSKGGTPQSGRIESVPFFFEVLSGGTNSLAKQATKLIAKKAAIKGASVIGPRTTYREFAKRIGANFLDVTDEAWTMRKNVQFLQGVVRRGDDVIFSGKFNPNLLKPNSVLGQEIRYLQRHGYSWTDDFSRLIKK